MTDSFAFLANCHPGQLIRPTRKQNEAGEDFKQEEFQTRPNFEPSEFKELFPKRVSGKAELLKRAVFYLSEKVSQATCWGITMG